jgi:hypothetical protein
VRYASHAAPSRDEAVLTLGRAAAGRKKVRKGKGAAKGLLAMLRDPWAVGGGGRQQRSTGTEH